MTYQVPTVTATAASILDTTTSIIRNGKEFPTRDAACRYIKDFALSQKKRAVVDAKLSGGNNFTIRCDSKTPCTFYVKISKSKAAGAKCLRITSYNLKHEGCSGSARATLDQVVRFSVTTAAVTAQPKISALALISQIKATNGVPVSKRMAYRARDAIVEDVAGSVSKGFVSLESLLQVYSAKNGGAFTSTEFDDDGHFVRAFLSHPYVRQNCESGQKNFGIDGTFAKHGQYPSTMLILIGRDGNNKNVVLGIGICNGETSANAEWFLECCEKAGVDFTNVPIFTDRGKALLAALGSRPGAVVRFCTRHLIGSVKHRFGKIVTIDVESDLWALQQSASEEDFKSRLTALSLSHPTIADYLAEIDAKNWVLFIVLGKTRLYGWRTTNFFESENGAAIPIRYMHAFSVFNHYIAKFMSSSVQSDQDVRTWLTGGNLVTPYAKELVGEQLSEIGYQTVRKSSEIIAFVHDERCLPRIVRRVDLSNGTCTCTFMDQYGIPCRHFLATLKESGQLWQMFNFFEPCYRIDRYASGYAASKNKNIELVLTEDLTMNNQSIPPLKSLVRGRKRVHRFPSQGESTNKKRGSNCVAGGSVVCSKCQMRGHNRRTCGA